MNETSKIIRIEVWNEGRAGTGKLSVLRKHCIKLEHENNKLILTLPEENLRAIQTILRQRAIHINVQFKVLDDIQKEDMVAV